MSIHRPADNEVAARLDPTTRTWKVELLDGTVLHAYILRSIISKAAMRGYQLVVRQDDIAYFRK